MIRNLLGVASNAFNTTHKPIAVCSMKLQHKVNNKFILNNTTHSKLHKESYTVCIINRYRNQYTHNMSYGRKYLFPSPNVGGPLSVIRVWDVRDINIKAGACNLHCGMIWFATWSSKPRCASSSWQQMQITIKYSNAPSFILVTLPIGTYPVGETMKLERKGG